MFPILVVLFQWNEEEANFYTSLIAACGLLGGVFGSLYGGRLVLLDRRKALVAINLTGILGATICTIQYVPAICIGRFLKGVAAIGFQMICPKIIFETAPARSLGLLGSFINTSISTGVMVTGLIGLGFQDASTLTTPQEVNSFWRAVFLFPIVINLFQLVMILFVYKQVSIVDCLAKDQDDAALALIKKVYRSDQNHKEILGVLKADITKSKKT